MVGDPSLSAASFTLTSIMKIFGQYQAYQSKKISDTDKGLRDEIGRRLSMVSNHVDVLESRLLASKDISGITILNRVRISLSEFQHEISFGITGSTEQTSVVAALKKAQIKSLLDHDLAVLKRLVKITHLINSVVDGTANPDVDIEKTLLEFEQNITGVRNRFSDRVSFLSGVK